MAGEERKRADAAEGGAAVAEAPEPAGSAGAPASGRPISRRNFALGVAGCVAVAAIGGGVAIAPRDELLRPPGGQAEDRLLSGCIHCDKCRQVCPHGAIVLAHLEDGFLSMRTPKMDFHLGYCDFCEGLEGGPRCSEVCPTGALPRLSDARHTTVIGKAELNRDWCLAARGTGCHVCVDACPYGALSLGYDHVPVVDEGKCNGCGLCELKCISQQAGSIAEGETDRAIVVVARDTKAGE